MKWSESYSTGVEHIDEQHRMLFRIVGDYAEALEEGRGGRVYGLLLETLAKYASGHFESEERCMHARRCPSAAANKSAHAAFKDELAKHAKRYRSDGYSAGAAADLLSFVSDWLVSHICKVDSHLRRCPAKA